MGLQEQSAFLTMSNTSTEAARQRRLVQAILADAVGVNGMGPLQMAEDAGIRDSELLNLHTYRDGARRRLHRALRIAYPTVHATLGDAAFYCASEELVARHPPSSGDAAKWGGAFPQLLAERADFLRLYPFLLDASRLDWAIHVSLKANPPITDHASISEFAYRRSLNCSALLNPTLRIFNTVWPLLRIRRLSMMRMRGSAQCSFMSQLVPSAPAAVAVWACAGTVRAQILSDSHAGFFLSVPKRPPEDAHPWLCHLSILSACSPTASSFESWFCEAIACGWVLGVRVSEFEASLRKRLQG